MEMGAIVLDSANSEELSDFYARLLNWEKIIYDEEWIIVKSRDGKGIPLVFQEVEDYVPPVWPNEKGNQQQQEHVDFYVKDVAASVAHAKSCGAVVNKTQFSDVICVMLDPAGHTFCIIPNKPPSD